MRYTQFKTVTVIFYEGKQLGNIFISDIGRAEGK